MTKLDDLRALYEAVKAGDLEAVNACLGRMFSADQELPWRWVSDANSAFRGSLDAADALHKAVLPGWVGSFDTEGFAKVGKGARGVQTVMYAERIDGNPARAWLLAQIAARMAMEGR